MYDIDLSSRRFFYGCFDIINKNDVRAVKRPDKKFVVGLQLHPEVAIRKILDKEQDANRYMDYVTAMKPF